MNINKKLRVPLSAHIVLTNRCNLSCEYCRVHELPQEDVWTTESLKNLLHQMYSCGTRRVHFTGGEPMLRDDISELISYAKELGLFVSVVSNGAVVAERATELKEADVVFISYDGLPKVHDRIRGAGVSERAISAIDALKAEGVDVWVTTVLTRLNVPRLTDIIKFAKEKKVTINFNPIEYFSEPPNHLHPLKHEIEDLVLSPQERKAVFARLIDFKRRGAPIGSSVGFLRNGKEWGYGDAPFSSDISRYYKCWAGRAQAHIEADGRLYACGSEVGYISGVDVIKNGFKKAWGSLPLKKNCNSCTHACMVEGNLIFSLNPGTIMNWMKMTLGL